MKLTDLRSIFHKELDVIYEIEEVNNFFFMISEHMCNLSRLQLALDQNLSITKAEQDSFFQALNALKNEKPIQYILGETEFYGLQFNVNEHVLIPRPETEELIEWIIKETETLKEKNLRILDIGTGSGCIAIALAKQLPEAKVFALDVSKKALETAKANASLNQVDINFIEADILEKKPLNLEFDIIVSNPPYVRTQEKELMKPNVLKYEPHLALFVNDEDPLQYYKAISDFAKGHLKNNGLLFFEINEFLGENMLQLLEANNFKNIELNQDIFQKDRCIKAEKY